MAFAPQFLREGDTVVLLAHHHVQDQQIRRRLHQQFLPLFAARGSGHLMSLAFEEQATGVYDARVVVYDRDPRHERCPFFEFAVGTR